MDTIPFLVSTTEEGDQEDEMGLFGRFRPDAAIALRSVPTQTLKNNLSSVSHSILKLLQDIKSVGEFKLKEITFQIEVSLDGSVSLIGTANIGGKGAIQLKFGE